jgi:Rrf2 family protein
MKLGDGVEWALHCCTVLGAMPPHQAVPASVLAEFHGVPSAYLAKQMQALSRDGIVESVPGRNGGYKLARPSAAITVLDVVLAIDGRDRAFRCTEVRQQGPSAVAPSRYIKPCGIAAAMWRAEEAFRHELGATTLADLVAELDTEVDPEQTEKAFVWLVERLSAPLQASLPTKQS